MKEKEILVNPYHSFIDDIFSASNIRRCEHRVISLQMNLDKAVANNDIPTIRETFNLLAKNSKAVKVLAVYRISQRNKGKYTPGVDGVSIPRKDPNSQYRLRWELLNEIDITRKPDPIKRIHIPKPNGKKRPLGIPTLRDRINQEILRIALEPITEYHFNYNSWGFRPKRSCHDAIDHLFKKLSAPNSFRYILEGDIKGCFDNINHEHIINTLSDWKVPKWANEILLKMLKSGILLDGIIHDSDTGTPQGGVISPLLANVALTSFDNFCEHEIARKPTKWGFRKYSNPLVRYADDFVLVCRSETEALSAKEEIAKHLSKEIGLTLSEEKTGITHITKGFNFLGFNVRKYVKPYAKRKTKAQRDWNDYILLIKPQKEKITEFLRGCKEVLDNNKSATQGSIIGLLNPKLTGWAMYYRHVVSKRIFGKVDHEIWNKLHFWSKRRHPSKSKGWINRKYFSRMGNRSYVFKDQETERYIRLISPIPIKRHVILKRNYRVYDKNPESREYWKKRGYTNAFKQIASVKMTKLYSKQKGNCSLCNEEITQEQIANSWLHVHHLLPRSLGGTDSYSNLRLLHDDCHRELHAKMSRKEMKELWKTENYLLSFRANHCYSNLESRVR